jgi:hypothetical protein
MVFQCLNSRAAPTAAAWGFDDQVVAWLYFKAETALKRCFDAVSPQALLTSLTWLAAIHAEGMFDAMLCQQAHG